MLSDNLLSNIKSPEDLKGMSEKDLNKLCEEIRAKLIETVSQNGGHLASNLGVVELTVALLKVFNSKDDKIVWDVGHQCYTHKMLTGRLSKINTIRKEGGLSGFPKRSESDYDAFNVGHSSTSISAAYGIAKAKNILDEKGHVIAVIGDGALTGGLAYEGLNNAGRLKKNFIVILNDNKMSISRNVGSMARHLSIIRSNPSYLRAKDKTEDILTKVPFLGNIIKQVMISTKHLLKNIIYKNNLFQQLGFNYYGPIDGHNVQKLTDILNNAKRINGPVLIHIITKKGKGYHYAEKEPNVYHGISAFNVTTGEKAADKRNFSGIFGNTLCDMAEKDDRICGITAAMKSGTGLIKFSKKFRERFFDVGIAEGHAVTFAAGLSAGGMLPVFAVYSSFLQRGYDQIIHDAAAQNLKVVLGIDRAGIVGEDGETHQGIFDTAFLNSIPNVTVFAPSFFDEMEPMLNQAMYDCGGVAAVRYPRGGELYRPFNFVSNKGPFDIYGSRDADILIVTYGRLFSYACAAREEMKKRGVETCIIKLNRIKPIDKAAVEAASKFKNIFFFEEGIKCGGIGEHFGQCLSERLYLGKFVLTAIDDKFIKHAGVNSTLHSLSLDSYGMTNIILTECLK